MTNIYDQFDNEQAETVLPVKNTAQANIYDQFDQEPVETGEQFNARLNERLVAEDAKASEQAQRGFMNNTVRGMGERTADLAAGFVDFNAATGAVPMVGGPGVPMYSHELYKPKSPERQEQAAKHGHEMAEKIRATDLGYDENRNTLSGAGEKFKKGDWLGATSETVAAALDSGLVSVPDMVAAGTGGGLPMYMMARTGEMANERAKNKGLDRPTATEITEAAPFAVASSMLERILPRRLMANGQPLTPEAAREISDGAIKYVLGKAAKEGGTDFAIEGSTEFIQEGVLEYVGERYGTDAQMSVAEGFKQGAEAAVLGGLFGGMAGTGKGAMQGVSETRAAGNFTPPDDNEIDQPLNGEQVGGGIVGDVTQEQGAPAQLQHNPQRMVVMPDGTTAWEHELPSLAEQQAASLHPAYVKINESPEAVEASLNEPTDIDAEINALLSDATNYRAEKIKQTAQPVIEKLYGDPGTGNFFDQFDAPADGLFDGVRTMQAEQTKIAQDQEAKRNELMDANFQEEEQGGFMSGVRTMAEQAQYEPIKNTIDPAEVAGIYPADPKFSHQSSEKEQRASVPIPENLNDQRIARPEYRAHLEKMAGDLIKGGGVGYVRDGNDRIVGRTPSLNDQWFQAMNQNPETSMSVDNAKAAIEKALKGEKLGVRQLRAVGAAMDAITGERGNYARELIAMRQNAKDDRQAAFENWKKATNIPDDSEFASTVNPEAVGETFNEDDYIADHSFDDRGVAELADQATEMGASWKAVDKALELDDINAQTEALTQLIWDLRNEHRAAAGKQPESRAEAQSEPRSRSGAAERVAEEAPDASQSEAAGNAGVTPSTALNYSPDASEQIDSAAAVAALSPLNDLPEPTDAQKEAGNYKKAHVKIHGLDISIENPKGSKRSGVDPGGKSWEVEMKSHYGYIKRTEGADGEHIDVFIGGNPESDKVFIVDQVNADGSFDEHKVMLGFDSKLRAISGYKANYSKGWKVGEVTSMSMDEFKDWVKNGDTKNPVAKSASTPNAKAKPAPKILSDLPAFEPTHTLKSDGTPLMKLESSRVEYVDEFGDRYGDQPVEAISVSIAEMRKKDANFKKIFAEYGADSTSEAGISFAVGWKDAATSGNLDKSRVMKKSDGMKREGFNPIDPYYSGFLSQENGRYIERRVIPILKGRADSDSGINQVSEPERVYVGRKTDVQNNSDRNEVRQSSANENGQWDLFAPRSIPHETARAQSKDNFNIRYEHTPARTIPTGTDTINNFGDLVHVVAPLRKRAQEELWIVTTDKNNKIIQIIGNSKGTRDGASVNPIDVVGSIAATDGATKVWLAHNHPTGTITPSSADGRITNKIIEAMDGLAVKYMGHAVLGFNGEATVFDRDHLSGEKVKATPYPRTKVHHITERTLRMRKDRPHSISSPAAARTLVSEIESESALILLDGQNTPLGTITMSDPEMSALRDHGMVSRIWQAIDSTNASNAIVKTNSREAAKNLINFLSNAEIKVLDYFSVGKSDGELISHAEHGSIPSGGGIFFSLKSDSNPVAASNRAAISEHDANKIIAKITRRFANRNIKISAVSDFSKFPMAIREYAKQQGKNGDDVKGVYHGGSIYLNLSALADDLDIERTIFHELHGHYGLRMLFGKDTATAMGRLYLAIGGSKGLKDLAKKHGVNLSKYEELLKSAPANRKIEIMTEELLAHIAQDSRPSINRWWKELLGAIRTWLRAHGFGGLGQFNDNEIMNLLKRSREAATDLKISGDSIAKALLEDKRIETAGVEQVAAYSLSGLPPKNRAVINSDPILAAWTMLAQDELVFQLPISEAKTLEGIFAELHPDIKFRRAPEFDADNNGAKVWALNPDKNTLALVFEKDDSVWIDVVDYKQGQGGRRVYNAVANYAYNTGKVFIGDPAGLSDKALSRRLENMISSALKFGTTKHLQPHEKQRKGGAGVPAINWIDGDDAHNLKEMINASYAATKNQFPEVEKLRYDSVNDQFIHEDGDVWNAESFNREAGRARDDAQARAGRVGANPSGAGIRGSITAGGRTLERAVLTHTLLRGTSKEQSELLAAFSRKRSERLRGTLYSLKGSDQTQETRPQGGFSVSEAGKLIPGVRERILRNEEKNSLPPSLQDSFSRLGQNKTFVDKFKAEVKRQLTPAGLLPKEVFDLKVVRDGELNGDEMHTRHTLRGFYDAIEAAYGKEYKYLKAGTKREINKVLRGEPGAQLAPSVIKALTTMRDDIKRLSAIHVRQLVADAADLKTQGKDAEAESKLQLIETISANFDTYLHRSYRAFDDKDWPNNVPAKVYEDAVKFLASEYADGNPVTSEHTKLAEKRAHMILHEGTAFDSMGAFIAESKLGAKDLSIMKKRKDVPAPIRALLGEYEDAAVNYAKSVTKMSRLVHNHGFLNGLKQAAFDLGLLHEKQNLELDATKKIAAEGSEAYAPLNGLYTTREFEQALKDALGKHNPNAIHDAIVAANGLVKFGKTVLSPTTAMRNFMSSFFFTVANGHFDYSEMAKSVRAAQVYFKDRGDQGVKDYMEKMRRLGVIYDSPYASEMMDLLKDSKLAETIERGGNWFTGGLKKGLEWSQKFYSFGDDFYKIVGFENEKAMLMKHKKLSEADAEKMAAERIRNTYPTYSMIGQGINKLRRFPLIGTFVSFPAEIIRTSYHITRYLKEDIKAHGVKSPLVQRKLAGYALAAGAIAGISALSAAIAGVTDDEEEALRLMAPEWQKNSTFLWLWKDDKGNRRYVDLSFLDPYGYWKRPITAVLQDQPFGSALASGANDLLSPFLSWDIAAKALGESMFNSRVDGGPIYNEADATGSIALDVSNHLRKALQPGIATNIERFILAGMGEKTKTGKPYEIEDEIAALFGWRAATFDPRVALYYQAFEYQDKKAGASKILTSVANDINGVSDKELKDSYTQSMEARKQAFDDMHTIVKAARASGLSDLQLMITLRNSGVSVKDARHLVSGKLPPMIASKSVLKGAIKKASAIMDDEVKQELQRREKLINDLRKQGANLQ